MSKCATTLRLQADLHARIQKASEANNSSLNEEMHQRLEQSFRAEDMEAMLRRVVRFELARMLLSFGTNIPGGKLRAEETEAMRAFFDLPGARA
jgi:hypothetical protein